MTTRHIPQALAGTALALALTACGSSGPGAGGTGDSGDSGDSGDTAAGTSTSAGPAADEQITPGGVAAIVLDHLGADAVRRVTTFEPEPGSVSVMIELRDRTPHNFAVQVYSPEQAGELGGAGTCPPKRRLGPEARCRVLDNGTAVMTDRMPSGFSDDNADGTVVSGTAVTEKDGASMAMYESYDDSPAVSSTDLEAILADERLTWLTDPAVNDAGADVAVKQLAG